jgi:Autographiviridae endonuclease VII
MQKCKINNCNKEVRSKNLCSTHYWRHYRYGTFDLPKCKSNKLLDIGMSRCPKCKQIKKITEFNKDKYTFTGLAIYCRSCNRLKSKTQYHTHKDNHKNTQLKSDFGITLEQYKEKLKNQNNCCAICKSLPKNNRMLSVDHCHKTGKVRGLLCSGCNSGLGYFKDNINIIAIAIKYLQNYD